MLNLYTKILVRIPFVSHIKLLRHVIIHPLDIIEIACYLYIIHMYYKKHFLSNKQVFIYFSGL